MEHTLFIRSINYVMRFVIYGLLTDVQKQVDNVLHLLPKVHDFLFSL